MPNSTLRLTQQLIALPSVTPNDGGCQALLKQRLQALNFECHDIPAGPADFRVSNLYAIRRGRGSGSTLAFAGHTDVVPTGPLSEWLSPPFTPTVREGFLYGRGAADMKASLAAMVIAVERFVTQHPEHEGHIAFLLTSDEEGPSKDGTIRICEWLQNRGERLDACIVGEPTSVERLGDTLKNGRRGSLSGRLTVKGVQGHIAYPHLARNPIHDLAPALAELASLVWDQGNAHFPPTAWQVSNIHGGTGASNVIPGEVVVDFNFRFSTESTPQTLQARVLEVLQSHGLAHELSWHLSGHPFLTPPGRLTQTVTQAIHAVTGIDAQLSTSGGTSDGRFIATLCPEVIELGPINESIHKINERVALADLDALRAIYQGVLERWVQ